MQRLCGEIIEMEKFFPPGPDYFPNNKRKAFVENMKRVAKEFHLEVIWKKSKDRDHD